MKSTSKKSGWMIWICVVVTLVTPAMIQSEILYLKDGSEVRGRVLSFTADTLTFEPSFGGRIRVHRSDIVEILFGDSRVLKATETTRAQAHPEAETGTLLVKFKDTKLSSKAVVVNSEKHAKAKIVRANWIEQLLIVEGDTVYSRVDTTMDKTIHEGHKKLYKNNIRLEDMNIVVGAGPIRCIVVVRSVGAETSADSFDGEPLLLTVATDTVVYPGRTTTLTVGLKKGFMKMGKPAFYIVGE